MHCLVVTNDPVAISFVTALLAAEGIEAVVADYHTSVLEGSIGALPRRVLIDADDAARARALIRDAGHGELLADPR